MGTCAFGLLVAFRDFGERICDLSTEENPGVVGFGMLYSFRNAARSTSAGRKQPA